MHVIDMLFMFRFYLYSCYIILFNMFLLLSSAIGRLNWAWITTIPVVYVYLIIMYILFVSLHAIDMLFMYRCYLYSCYMSTIIPVVYVYLIIVYILCALLCWWTFKFGHELWLILLLCLLYQSYVMIMCCVLRSFLYFFSLFLCETSFYQTFVLYMCCIQNCLYILGVYDERNIFLFDMCWFFYFCFIWYLYSKQNSLHTLSFCDESNLLSLTFAKCILCNVFKNSSIS